MEAEKRWCCSSTESSVVKYSPVGNGMTTEDEDPPLLIFITN
jgi:hypothetical protein